MRQHHQCGSLIADAVMTVSTIIDDIRSHWLLLSFAAGAFYLFGAAIYNCYFSPLAKYPGPFLAKISAWPSFYYSLTGYRHVWIWRCHQIYGDKFRYHPNGIIINSPNAYRDIYNVKANVKKSMFYDASKRNANDLHTLNTTDKLLHARKRRVLNSVFSEKAIQSAETFIIKHVNRWCELLLDSNNGDWSTPKNMAQLCDCLMFDTLGDLCFGRSFEIKEPGDNVFRHIPHAITSYLKFQYPLTQSPMLSLWVWLKPRGLNEFLEYITPNDIKQFFAFVEDSVAERSKAEQALQNQEDEKMEGRKDMFHYLFQAKDSNTGAPAYTRHELIAEAKLLIIAGSDTTAVTVCGLFFYITRNFRVYSKLTNEIRTTFKSIDEIRGGSTLSSCQYLRACIDEALRMCPAGTSDLPRVVLPGGVNVDGEIIPEGVQIGTAGWSLQYHEEYILDPFVYRPERWIADDEAGVTIEDVARARSCWYPFSAGPGSCVGKNLALLELMIITARTLYQMDVRVPPGNTLGEGAPHLGWGRRNNHQFQLQDAYVSLRDGPMVQFKKRAV